MERKLSGSVVEYKNGKGIIKVDGPQAPIVKVTHTAVELAGAMFLVPGQEVRLQLARLDGELCAVGVEIV